ncbi:hypothetical protein [Geodermatophilus sp. URMC 63]
MVLTPSILAIYSVSSSPQQNLSTIIVPSICVALYPIIGSLASPYYAILLTSGRVAATLWPQAFRYAIPLTILAASDDLTLIVLAFLLGEAVRVSTLTALGRRLCDRQPQPRQQEYALPSFASLLHQVTSMSVTQTNPVVNKAFLVAGPSGSVAASEIADKLFFASNQVLNNLRILPRVARLPTVVGRGPHRARLVREIRAVTLPGIALGLGPSLVLVVAWAYAPTSLVLAQALLWGALLLVSLPFVALNTFGARVMVLAGRASVLTPIAMVSVITNLAMNWVIFGLIGPTGVLVSTLIVRVIVGCIFLYMTLSSSTSAALTTRISMIEGGVLREQNAD